MNNNKIVSSITKRTSAIFLAIVLITGTIAVISSQSSFIVGAQAQPYYGIDNNYEKSYGKENYKSAKDSNIDLNKIKCKNINININNGQGGNNVNTTNGDNSTNGNKTNNGNKKFHKDGFAFVCINNNNNIVTGSGGNATDDDDGTDTVRTTLSVSKNIGDCDPIDNSQNAIDACMEIETQILPNLFTLSVIDNTLIATLVEGSEVPVVVTLNPGDYQVLEVNTLPLLEAFNDIREEFLVEIDLFLTVTGACTPIPGGAAGTIAAGESQTCNIVNSFEVREMI